MDITQVIMMGEGASLTEIQQRLHDLEREIGPLIAISPFTRSSDRVMRTCFTFTQPINPNRALADLELVHLDSPVAPELPNKKVVCIGYCRTIKNNIEGYYTIAAVRPL